MSRKPSGALAMFETQIHLYDFMRGYCHQIMADVGDDQLAHRPFERANPPGWILGHLAICTDFAATMLGGRRDCPKPWHELFSPKSVPSSDPASYPKKTELLAAYDEGHQRVVEVLNSAAAEVLDQPHSIDFLRGSAIVTVRDLVGHLMTTHEAFHVGQLSTWRRQMGFAPIV